MDMEKLYQFSSLESARRVDISFSDSDQCQRKPVKIGRREQSNIVAKERVNPALRFIKSGTASRALAIRLADSTVQRSEFFASRPTAVGGAR